MRRRFGMATGSSLDRPSSAIGAAQPAGVEHDRARAARRAAPVGDLARDARPERDEHEVVAVAEPDREQAGRVAARRERTHAGVDGERERDGIGDREHGRTSISKWGIPLREMGWSGTTDGGSGHRAPMPGNLPAGSDNFATSASLFRARNDARSFVCGNGSSGTVDAEERAQRSPSLGDAVDEKTIRIDLGASTSALCCSNRRHRHGPDRRARRRGRGRRSLRAPCRPRCRSRR